VVNSTFVVKEVLVDLESSLHWSVQIYLLLDLLRIHSLHNRASFTLVFLEFNIVILALQGTLRYFSLSRGIRHTIISCGSCFLEEVPDIGQLSTITPIVSGVALNYIFRGEHNIYFSLRSNAESV